MIRFYAYKGCDTCRKARKWLEAHDIAFEERAIRETPPSPAELERALEASGGELKRLFNTSSKDYREAGLKDRLPGLDREAAFALLRENGNLVKRPFVVGDDVALIGFDEATWRRALGQH